MHVVHAPDFPHAVVANVNVHCLRPASIRSLAVAFLGGGGAEVPGMGDPVEGMYEVRVPHFGVRGRFSLCFLALFVLDIL